MKMRLLIPTLMGLLTTWYAQGKPVEGVITEVYPEKLRAILQVQQPGSEPLEVQVGRGDAIVVKEGMPVRGDLVEVGNGLRLQTIWPNDPVIRGTVVNLGRKLRQDTLQRGSKVFRGVGEFVPKFALYDEDGKLFLSDSLRGKYAVINFIFTRCTMQNMCPAATERMRQMKDLAEKRGMKDYFRQVSITLDPAYDTPGIFTAYAQDKGIETDTFHFLGGPESIVEDLKKQLGVLAEPDEKEIIRHTMSTALIDPTGKIIYRIPGSMWDPEVFLNKVEEHRAEVAQLN